MKISYNLINEIFKTLPVGYYLGRRINHSLDEICTASYFDPAKDVIVVSYPMIKNTLSNVTCNKEDYEELVRTILYHEISHVILTPQIQMTRVVNIVEDERIETIMRNYYMNTNFRKVVKLINNYHGEKPKDKDDAFYQLVRYRVGEEKWLKRLVSLLNKHKNLNSRHFDFNPDCGSDYTEDIYKFYNKFCDEWEASNPKQDENNPNTKSQEFDEKNGNSLAPTSNDKEMESENEEAPSNTVNESEKDFTEDIIDAENVAKNAINSTINRYSNEALTSTLKNVVDRKLKQNKQSGAAISSYSGRLNKRAVANRDDYRWWVAQNREGNIRRFANVHFNLFIDNSGSFQGNDTKMNTFIKSLDKISKTTPQFTFDVITINSRKIEEWDDHDKEFHSYGGSALDRSIEDVVKKHIKNNAENYNIVLFDGDIHLYDDTEPGDKDDTLKYFNIPNTFIISDDENKRYLDKIEMNKAKVKYVTNYCAEFINTITALLEKAI